MPEVGNPAPVLVRMERAEPERLFSICEFIRGVLPNFDKFQMRNAMEKRRFVGNLRDRQDDQRTSLVRWSCALLRAGDLAESSIQHAVRCPVA